MLICLEFMHFVLCMVSYDNRVRGNLMPYMYKSWALYKQDIEFKDGRKQTIYFFTRWKPKRGTPCNLPDGYTVVVNERTGLPHLEKIASADISYLPFQ